MRRCRCPLPADRSSLSARAAATLRSSTRSPPRFPAALNSATAASRSIRSRPQPGARIGGRRAPRGSGSARTPRMAALAGDARRGSWGCRRRAAEQARDWVKGRRRRPAPSAPGSWRELRRLPSAPSIVAVDRGAGIPVIPAAGRGQRR
ncbi:hypothetical protein GQ55_3G097600 [Panicum hallii var. hallii]|uniref:Uncharacterized protein n=1 Tax=Panicum hallii var. hallii TaxID=1504633 RepID=A0A2T7E7L9_9POAL|nr:hypothetical protein GQ55_3G097600 [Panicum hallii var. hallii]